MKHFIEIGDEFETNSYGKLKLIEKQEKGYYLVEFLDTGYRTTANRQNILKGKVRDKSKKHHCVKEWEDVNIPLENNAGDKLVIVQRRAKECVVHFIDTNYMTHALYENVIKGKIADPYKRTVLGIGYIGEYKPVSYWKKAKQLWSNMMKRCYNPNDERGYYGKCFVDVRWHSFANFLEDLPTLNNFNEWLDFENTGTKYNLDKDLKIPGNNIYSPIACSFEDERVNKGATSRNNYYR